MFKTLRNKKAQSFAVEYAIVFFIVVTVITVMSVFVQRSMQGRIRDARNYMLKTVDASDGTPQSINVEYEPYYADSEAIREADFQEIRTILGSFPKSSGIYESDVRDIVATQQLSNQAPPKDAD